MPKVKELTSTFDEITMSRRPAGTLTGQPGKGRLHAVLAAGLAHHAQRRPAPTDAPKPDIDSDDEESLPLTERPAYKRRKAPPPPAPGLLDALAGEPGLLVYILSFSGGMSCEEIAQQCSTSKAFAQVCREDLFWMWQCQLRGYDREDRLQLAIKRGTVADKRLTPVNCLCLAQAVLKLCFSGQSRRGMSRK
jgi:hypothetical protein